MKSLKPNSPRLRDLRDAKSWTQEQLAEVSGVSLRTIQRAERGDAIDMNMLGFLAEALGVGPDELIEKPDPATEELVFLPRLIDGTSLGELAGCYARVNMQDEPQSPAERDALATFIDNLEDWNLIWSTLSGGERLRACASLREAAQALETAGYWIFGAARQRRVTLAEGKPMTWPVAYLVLARPDGPSVMRNAEEPNRAGLFAVFPAALQMGG